MMGATGFDPAVLGIAGAGNPDVGARIISPSVKLSESQAVGVHPTFTVIEPAEARAVIGYGDGTIRGIGLMLGGVQPSVLAQVSATPITAAVDIGGAGVLIGTDGGDLLRLDGSDVVKLAETGGPWIGEVAVHSGRGLRAFAAAKALTVLDAGGAVVFEAADHPSTVAGLSFSPDGTRIAAAHYGGVSVWKLTEPGQKPVRLDWHGSHTAVAWSPNGQFIVSAMQDKEMHCWRWKDRTGMRMSGYPSKIRAIAWTADGQYVAASGADTVTSWDCSGKGPSGKPPLEFGYVYDGVVRQVAAHPADHVVAGGYSDGTVLIGAIEQETAMIARPASGHAVTGLAWTADGGILVATDESGAVAVMRILEPVVS
ncbi:WD40 repeat domain-containing protein [bacterium SCSIO 12827]|nr:WD40 repeat domain-containing protein [bacterium SCSIO 12827]